MLSISRYELGPKGFRSNQSFCTSLTCVDGPSETVDQYGIITYVLHVTPIQRGVVLRRGKPWDSMGNPLRLWILRAKDAVNKAVWTWDLGPTAIQSGSRASPFQTPCSWRFLCANYCFFPSLNLQLLTFRCPPSACRLKSVLTLWHFHPVEPSTSPLTMPRRKCKCRCWCCWVAATGIKGFIHRPHQAFVIFIRPTS